MTIEKLIQALTEMKKNWGDIDVKLDIGVSAALGKHQYVAPSTMVRSFIDKDGNHKKTLVLW